MGMLEVGALHYLGEHILESDVSYRLNKNKKRTI